MAGIFLIALREALQAALLMLIVLEHSAFAPCRRALMYSVAAGAIAGAAAAWSAPATDPASASMLRYIAEFCLFYFGLVILATPHMRGPRLSIGAVIALGLALYAFESRALWLMAFNSTQNDISVSKASAMAIAGTIAGFAPLVALRWHSGRLGLERFFSVPSAIVAIGAAKLISGGVGEVEDGSILTATQQGLHYFIENAIGHLRHMLMLESHAFLSVPLDGLFVYLAGPRTATAFLVIMVTVPPLLLLVDLFSRPDPYVKHLNVAAERRLVIAFFRREMIYKSGPLILSTVALLISMHAVNANVNPMVEPAHLPVREADESPGEIHIALTDKLGDFTDGMLRKYVYYYGTDKVRFMAMMKPDGSLGVALDECEICKPAEWNTKAIGYAQRGDTLVCKYCMTPIPVSALNKPGGCNPIPVSFTLRDNTIVIELGELLRVYKAAKNMDKKGTHF